MTLETKQKIYIGTDGGGTKCKIRIEDAAGQMIGQARGGPANIRFSTEKTWNSIVSAIKEALTGTDISLDNSHYRFYGGLGLAGTEIPEAVTAFLAHPLNPFYKLCLKSDAYAACLGAHDGQDGGIIIIGTGVIGMAIQAQHITQVGGWGFPCGDEGGGAWLGLEATRITMHAYDGRTENSALTQAILQRFDNQFADLVTWANVAKPTQFAELAPLVIEHVEKKDPHAVDLIQRAATEINRLAKTLDRRTKPSATPLTYALFGGLAPFIAPWLDPVLLERLVDRKHDATKGAIIMIQQELSQKT